MTLGGSAEAPVFLEKATDGSAFRLLEGGERCANLQCLHVPVTQPRIFPQVLFDFLGDCAEIIIPWNSSDDSIIGYFVHLGMKGTDSPYESFIRKSAAIDSHGQMAKGNTFYPLSNILLFPNFLHIFHETLPPNYHQRVELGIRLVALSQDDWGEGGVGSLRLVSLPCLLLFLSAFL